MQLLGSGTPPPIYTPAEAGEEGLAPLLTSPTSGGTSQARLVRQVWGPAKGFVGLWISFSFAV